MRAFDPRHSFGPDVAARYDSDQSRGDEQAAAAFLAEQAAGGRALEFAIGTGRIALPLAALGVSVDGIELSSAMVDELRTKPGGAELHVELGDMTTMRMGGAYELVYLVYNTIFNLLTADDQIRCFENAAHHLADRGVFVVETAVPHAWMRPGRSDYVHTEFVELAAVGLDVARYDPVTQLLSENHVAITAEGIRFNPIVARLITPGEMDLMARLAGLRLVERVGNWQRTPFGTSSKGHVSVYARAGDATP
jgi:SAM-dependent methyltransferase